MTFSDPPYSDPLSITGCDTRDIARIYSAKGNSLEMGNNAVVKLSNAYSGHFSLANHDDAISGSLS